MSAIELDAAEVHLGEVVALHATDLHLDAERTAVIGANGSGKSSLARLVGGLVPASGGATRVLGLDPRRDARELRHRVAFVFSNPDAQIIMPTVAEDVAFSLRTERLPNGERDARVAAALERFGLAELATRAAHELSGGQKQLLALAGAFVREPELVIADEPTAFLDARNARLVAEHLLRPSGHRLLLLTHDLELAARCEEAVLVDAGRVVAVGPSSEVVGRYRDALEEPAC
ncbi:energy-coupling factor ABC transporter ATP-binding protein [Homoserinibacter sp. YIM 151385]|uniref:energy-coupling factor ABC transporter ATP-binding protein n=1 Tax=Homoserinibacter sp. YIM 151385 TaxID=2985506 RepID=UPI0022F0665A|nr:ABC transporter ATP-binding protein [Homoserinibacter sp. YIM 151385]WBU38783.1 ABC transporter ATP-binding protein [Homoserinibacter sp. YIM 151385]